MRVLLVEPWLDGSHRRWAEGYRAASAHDVEVIGLPGALWRWRLRGGALPLADRVGAWVDDHGRPDVLLVGGLVDVAHLVGLTRRVLGPDVAVVTYQHESQLVHPVGRDDQEAALRNWLSWCASDLVVFNSGYHRRAVTEALGPWLDRLPDRSHRTVADRVTARFDVVPVGVDPLRRPAGDARPARSPDGPIILWPHRWERDKNPDVFAAALGRVADAGLPFRLVLAGEEPTAGSERTVTARAEVAERFGSAVVAVGPFDDDHYRRLVASADIVVSCADHEFFGVAVVEAVGAGCVPLLPDDLSYPELIDAQWHDVALYRRGTFGSSLVAAVADHDRRRLDCAGLAATMDRFAWPAVAPALDGRLERLLGALRGGVAGRGGGDHDRC
ncbi:MAG: DUF3524 domain-containing protein [Acidimicrobiales bacterium]